MIRVSGADRLPALTQQDLKTGVNLAVGLPGLAK